MYNSKLYSILEHFDKYEQNRFRKYLHSPYFNRNENLINLFEVLIKQMNKKNGQLNGHSGMPEKESIWKKLEPGKPFNDIRFRKYLSDLLKLVESFLAQQIYEEDPIQSANYLILAVGIKKLKKLYNSTMKTARRISGQTPFRSASFYLQQYHIENNYYRLQDFDLKRNQRSNEEEISKNLDYFFMAEKLRLANAILSRQDTVSQEYHIDFMKETLQIVEQIDYENIPAVAAYYQIYLTHTSPEEKHYFKLKEIIEKNISFFPKSEGHMIYTYAINYCSRRINQGQSKFLNELFSLYKVGIENQILFGQYDVLDPWNFQNIVVLALRLGHYDWTEQFIHKYMEKLPESFRENAYTYSLAQVYFYQKKHEKVIEQLREVEYDDVSYNLRSKAMLLATYYEMDELEPLYSLFESFRAYLNRHKDIPPVRRKNYGNLIKFTKKLSKIMPGDQRSIDKLKEEVSTTKNIASVSWLKEKIIELE